MLKDVMCDYFRENAFINEKRELISNKKLSAYETLKF